MESELTFYFMLEKRREHGLKWVFYFVKCAASLRSEKNLYLRLEFMIIARLSG